MQIRDFRLIWLARFASVLATSAMVVIIGYQLYDLARSDYGMTIAQASFQLGVLGLAQFVPLLVLTPLAGLVADRFDRRKIVGLAIATDLLIALTLGLFTHLGRLNLPLLFALAACHGAARVFVSPAMSAITPNVVPARLLPRAIAFGSFSWQAGAVGGPALGGLMYGANPALPYWTAAALLGIAALGVMALKPLPVRPLDRAIHPLRQIADGWRYVRHERLLLGCVTLDLFAVLLGGATALLPVYARDILFLNGAPVGAHGLGLMRAAPALGAAVVAIGLALRPIERNVGTRMLWAVAAYGAATLGFGLSRSFILSLALLALLGAADMVSVFIRSSLVQIHTPDAMRGRVSSISGLAISASNELGEMQSGLAAALLGATGAVAFGGVGAIAVTAIWAWFYPELRNARTFAPQTRSPEIQMEPAP